MRIGSRDHKGGSYIESAAIEFATKKKERVKAKKKSRSLTKEQFRQLMLRREGAAYGKEKENQG